MCFISFSAQAQFPCAENICPEFEFEVKLRNFEGEQIKSLKDVQPGEKYYIFITDKAYVSRNGNVIVCVTGASGFDVKGMNIAQCEEGNACFNMGSYRKFVIQANASSVSGMKVSLSRACLPKPYRQDTEIKEFDLFD